MRAILNKALRDFCQELPVVFVLTVVSADAAGTLHTRGLYATTAARLATATSAQDRATSARGLPQVHRHRRRLLRASVQAVCGGRTSLSGNAPKREWPKREWPKRERV